MHGLLRPGGWFVAAFPVLETWYEGHVGFYFAHRFRSRRLRRSYLSLGHRLGCGLYRKFPSRERWLSYFEDVLDRACFYRPRQQIVTALEKAFGAAVGDLAADYMRTRLGAAGHHLPGFADPLLRFVYRRRAGELIRVQ